MGIIGICNGYYARCKQYILILHRAVISHETAPYPPDCPAEENIAVLRPFRKSKCKAFAWMACQCVIRTFWRPF